MKCPGCGGEMVKTPKGRFECRNDGCDVIEVRGGYRRGLRVIRETREPKDEP